MPDRPSRGQPAAVLQAVLVSVLGVLPAFFVGALAVQIRADLEVGLAAFGLATATLFAVSGLLARPCGQLVQQLGVRRGTALAAAVATGSLCAVALAQSQAWLMAALALGGLGNAIAQPSANLGISELVTERRLGLAFGIKQSSIPLATLLGGLAVPGIALVVGWRWAMGAAALLALSVLLSTTVTRRRPSARRRVAPTGGPDKGLPRRGLLVLTAGGFLGSAASTSTGVFLVDSGVDAGLSPGAAGLMFAGCSVVGLASRVGFGWVADRHADRSRYLFIANLLTSGALGYVLLASGSVPLFALGALIAYGLGWAWTGLFHFAIIKDNRVAAASATGSVQTGLSLGAASGPLGFGLVAQATSYRTAWLMAAALSLAAALTVRAGRRMVRQSRGLPVSTHRRSGDATAGLPEVQSPARQSLVPPTSPRPSPA
ncbi:MAG: MFS transporter [Pseudorhodobacter sp.]|nr:MFS transporter [Frankiaceae bacterium]